MFFQYNSKSKKSLKKKNEIIINSLFFIVMQVMIIVYTIIRVFMMNIYVGVNNYGLLSLIITISPIAVVFITASQSKSLYVLYNYALKKDYNNLNVTINQQINEIKKSSLISIISVVGLMLFSYFLVKSPGMSNFVSLLLVVASTIELLSVGLIVPYVQWYLNAIYKNYIFDFFSTIFSTLFNLLSFVIIGLYGAHVINFHNLTEEISSTYITLIVSFLLSFKYWVTNSVLLLFKKKWMPWFKRNKKIKGNIFSHESMAYFWHELLAFIAGLMIPIVLYIFTAFIPLATSLSGIYYSYMTFIKLMVIVGLILSSLRPYIAKVFENESKQKLFKINNLMYEIGFFVCIWIGFNLIIIVPYIMIFTHNLFSFIISFLMVINVLIYALKSIDENFIYLHGKPEKYVFLTLFEIIIGLCSMIIGFFIIFFTPSLLLNVLNIIYCLIICETILRFGKYCANIFYLNKFVYEISMKDYFKAYYKLHIFFLLFIISISLFIIFGNLGYNQEIVFTNKYTLNIYSKNNISMLFNDNIRNISWRNLITFWFFANIFFISILCSYYFVFENDKTMKLINIYKKNILHKG